MDDIIGLLKIKIIKGTNLVVKDAVTSDPYVIIKNGKQKVKTRVIKRNLNPVWNEDLTISIKDFESPIHLTVFDKDTFNKDDKMGNADIDITTFIESLKMGLENLPIGTTVDRVRPNRTNCLAEESCVIWDEGGKIYQDMSLRLRDVSHGEIHVRLEWIDIPGRKAF